MRAAVVEHPGPDAAPRVVDRAEPEPGPGEALVRVTATALAHLDLSVGTGAFGSTPPLPYVPCADGAGVVLRAAAGGTGPREGETVWIRGGGLGVTRDGLAAQVAAVPAVALHPCDPGVDPALAAAFFSPATSALVAVHDLGRVGSGSTVLVSGAAGSVGALAVQLAVEAGARVAATVSRPERLADVPPQASVRVAGEPSTQDLGDLAPVDVLIDTVGGPGLPARLALVKPGGRAVLVGYTAGTELTVHLPAFMRADVALLPLNMQRRGPSVAGRAPALLTRLGAGELRLPLRRYPLEEVARAWSDLAAGRVAGRAVLLP